MSADITKRDGNFKQESAQINVQDKTYILPCGEIDLYGGTYDEKEQCFTRLLNSAAKYLHNVGTTEVAGMRARFQTDSKKFTISVSYRYLMKMTNMSLAGSSGFTLLEETEKGCELIACFRPNTDSETGYSAQTPLKGGMRNYILHFPPYQDYITQVKLGFDGDCTVKNGNKYRFELPIVYYGSSITQGGCSSRPDATYQALISKWHDVDFLNLGFCGAAKGEDCVIEYLSNLKAKIFVCDYDYNAPDAEHLNNTHFKLYSEYRKANPETPIIFMTRPNFERDVKDNTKRLKVVKRTYLKAKEKGDENVYFLDGRKLFGKKDREICTVDGTHPNDLGFYRMALALDKVIAPLLK